MYISRQIESFQGLFVFLVLVSDIRTNTVQNVVKYIKEDKNIDLNLDSKDNDIGNDIKKILEAFPEGKVLKN